jgi:hypothetical protein
MVPSNLSGMLINLSALLALPDLFPEISFIFPGESEKKATSDPEIKADDIRRSSKTAKPVIRPGKEDCCDRDSTTERY